MPYPSIHGRYGAATLLLITGSEAQKLQGIFGVAMVDANGNARPLVDTLTEIQQATKDWGPLPRRPRWKRLSGTWHYGRLGHRQGWNFYQGPLPQQFEPREAFRKRPPKDGRRYRRIVPNHLVAVEGVYLAIGKALEPAMKRLADTTTEVLGGVVKWIDENRQAVATAMKWTAAIAGMVLR